MENVLTQDDILNEFKISRQTLYRWRKAGGFPQPIQLAGVLRWRRDDIEAFRQSGQVELMQIDERETEQTIAEAKADPTWRTDIPFGKELREIEAKATQILAAAKALKKLLAEKQNNEQSNFKKVSE